MWTGYVPAMKLYMDAMVAEWVRRGYNNSYDYHYPLNWDHLNQRIETSLPGHLIDSTPIPMPPWMGDEDFHSSHRRALLLKSEYYDQFSWEEALTTDWDSRLDQTYWWPRFNVPADTGKSYALRRKGDY